ncbi:PIN domain-containing protein [Deinococcus sp. AJ005]|uniref:PIN domain-containing protein n=1 Tax=Deinococcus sp. AJ005 TaxID=2652443 RepID=UPI00125CAF99|nr:PIN domain-containing protein [Deinococcus sp. AJ005]QFP77594.1 PIN domain-containing protein [Deinococcus sp. AJ005]
MLLDASALLAYLLKEEGGAEVLDIVSRIPCQVSSVTMTEVQGKLVGRGELTPTQVQMKLGPLMGFLREIPFDPACREKAAFYYARKSPYDLSLGDACCLGTAEALGMDVLTAERGWAVIPDLPFQVQLIR